MLNHELGELGVHRFHKFVHKLHSLRWRHSGHAQTEIEGILEVLLVVRAEINADRDLQDGTISDAESGSEECFANRGPRTNAKHRREISNGEGGHGHP